VRWYHSCLSVLLLALSLGVMVGCAGQSTTALADATMEPVSESVPVVPPEDAPVAPTSTVKLTNANWNLALSDADQYRGATVDVVGKVFAEKREGDAWALQIWTDLDRSSGNTVVVFRSNDRLANQGDYIRVEGTLDGLVEGSTSRGTVLRLPRVFASTVQRVNPVRVNI
jgi:hypothetical protein